MRKSIRYIFILFASLFVASIQGKNVKAGYEDTCNIDVIETKYNSYYKCGDNIIYLLPGNKNSSYVIAAKDFNNEKQILYAGVQDGLDTFYTTRFRLYSVVHDNRALFHSDENMWVDLSINGVVVYDGAFKDSALVDNSRASFYRYNEKGTYLIRQYFKGEIIKSIRMIVVDRLDSDITIDSALWGNSELKGEIVTSKENIVFNVDGGKYGFDSKVSLKFNSCEKQISFSKKLELKYEDFADCLKDNDYNSIALTLKSGLGSSSTFKYSFKVVGETVSIKLVDSVSSVVSSSRRIVIKASPGKDNTLDNKYSLYYWSKNPNDKLTYDEFMINYKESENRGTYKSNTGVILRNEEGVYYLYALAKDEDSTTVVRSSEYILTKQKQINKVSRSNVVFVVMLVVISSLPIFIYLIIREKDTI